MSDLGDDLRRARERAGISLQKLSARTKIREGLLDAIEHDDFGRLPAGLLVRGYLRAYAKEVGLEPESIVQRFKSEFEPSPALAHLSEQTDEDIRLIARRIQSGLGVLVLLAIAAVFIYIDRQGGSENTQNLNLASTGGEAGGSGLEPPPNDVKAGAGQDPGTAADSSRLTVRIDPTQIVWVQATADGRRVLSSLIHPGQPQIIEADARLVLRVGDAGAFRYTVNGVRGRSIGVSGEVREMRVTRDNYVNFQDP